MTSLRRVQSYLIITQKMLFIFYIFLHVFNIAFGKDDEMKRYIRDDRYKMPIFGSYMYDPIKQQFEESQYIEKGGADYTTTTTTTTTTTIRPTSVETELDEITTTSTRTTAPRTSTTANDHDEHDHDHGEQQDQHDQNPTTEVADTRTKAPYRKNVRAKDSAEAPNTISGAKRPKLRAKKEYEKRNQTGYRYHPVS